jgi:transposase-like protein
LGYGYIFAVPNWRASTLMGLIDRFTTNHSHIYTDQYSSYVDRNGHSKINRDLPHKNLLHLWVNHSVGWTNIFDHSIHTNTIERFWRSLRKKIKKNLRCSNIQDHVNMFIFIKMFPKNYLYSVLMEIIINYENLH